ncbi:MAG TPA: acyl-ACP--UDP-N-acetylglucosamine O-acyltransferase [Chthoniobacterales bacterium]|nr:acyl-ACP--UDP-N-acetylglucosamine O-acyltransferase [Chthoniobacterales bacterium]
MNIHHTAIIDPKAKLGVCIEVGPYVVVNGGAEIGDHSTIDSHAVIQGDVRIGSHNVIGPGAIIGTPPQDLSYSTERKTGVQIGNENVIREHCTIHRGSAEGSATRIGHGNFLMAGAHVGHNCEIGNNVIIANNCLLGGHVSVGDGAFLGGGCVFHQNIRVGRLAITQGASAFSKDIPPFVIAAERNCVFGLNVIGLRRAGFSAQDRDEIKTAFKLVYASGLNIAQAIEKAATMKLGSAASEFIDFVGAAKKRGICPLKSGADIEMSH